MYKAVQSCTNCGAGLTLDDMRADNCPYCQTVYPHKSMAAQHADMANQMMGNMVAQQAAQQNAWRQSAGLGPMIPGGVPPPRPSPGLPGGPPPGMAPPGVAPHMQPYNAMVQQHMAQANATARGIQKTVMWSLIGSFVFAIAITVLVMLL